MKTFLLGFLTFYLVFQMIEDFIRMIDSDRRHYWGWRLTDLFWTCASFFVLLRLADFIN